jgi:PKD repeat protein
MIGSPESQVVGTPFPGSCSVGGAWYSGNTYPAEYKNTFFTGDFAANTTIGFTPWLKRISIDFTDMVTRVDDFARDFEELVCITTNPVDGSLVTVELASPTGVKSIVYGGNQPPVARITANVTYGGSPLSVNFTGSGSTDATQGGSIVSHSWNFGGGNPATSNVANPGNIVFTDNTGNPKKFVVKLTVTDNGGAQHTDSIIISVNNTPPVVNITSPVKNSFYNQGPDTLYALTATVTDAEHNASQLTYEWQATLRHNAHEHREAIQNEVNSSAMIQRVGFYGSDTYYWLVELTVTDDAGLATKDSSKIFPNLAGADATLNGAITLQGRPAAPNAQWQVPLTVDFYAAGNMTAPAFSYNITTDNSGLFTINNIPVGSYKVAVKNSHTLKKVSSLETFGAGVKNLSFGLLQEGDINSDNFVTLSDISILVNNYNKAVGAPGVNGNADLNGDGFITLADISLLVNNYNSAGQTP